MILAYFLTFYNEMSVAQRFRRRSVRDLGRKCLGSQSLLGVHGFEPSRSFGFFYFLFNLFSKEKLICDCVLQLHIFFKLRKNVAATANVL